MPLHLKLRRGEKLLVNGAVLEMGDRYGEIVVHNQTNCLRGSDLLREEDATTPTRRVYFAVQMMIVDPPSTATWRLRFDELVTQLEAVFTTAEMLERLRQVRAEVAESRPYRALALLRAVRKYEEVLLSAAALRAAETTEREAHQRLRRDRAPFAQPGAQP